MNDPSYISNRIWNLQKARCRLAPRVIGEGILRSKSLRCMRPRQPRKGIPLQIRAHRSGRARYRLDRLADLLTKLGEKVRGGSTSLTPAAGGDSLLHELSPEAQSIGAVQHDPLSSAHRASATTPRLGFAEGFRRGLGGVSIGRVVQVGAVGGAATGFALLELGARQLTIVESTTIGPDPWRPASRCVSVTGTFKRPSARGCHGPADGSSTRRPSEWPAPRAQRCPWAARSDQWVADIVYVPLETELCVVARRSAAGHSTAGKMWCFRRLGPSRSLPVAWSTRALLLTSKRYREADLDTLRYTRKIELPLTAASGG